MEKINKSLKGIVCPICKETESTLSIGSTDKGVALVACERCNIVLMDSLPQTAVEGFSSPIGEKVKEIFGKLDELRGYRPPKRKAEAASIIRMLKHYTPDQITNAWQRLKQDKFWQDKELFMMTVESQIGAVLKNGTYQQNPRAIKKPEEYTTPDTLRHS